MFSFTFCRGHLAVDCVKVDGVYSCPVKSNGWKECTDFDPASESSVVELDIPSVPQVRECVVLMILKCCMITKPGNICMLKGIGGR